MNAGAIQAGLFVIIVALLVKPVGAYLERVFERRQTFLDAVLLPIERRIYRLVGADCLREMDWKRYSLAFGTFVLVNIVLLYRWKFPHGVLRMMIPVTFTTKGVQISYGTGPKPSSKVGSQNSGVPEVISRRY